MGLKRNQYFIGSVISSILLTTVLQAVSHIIGFVYKFKTGAEIDFLINEKQFIILALVYYLQQTFVSFAFSYAFQKIDTARSITSIIFPLVFYYTVYAILSESQTLFKIISPFTEFLDYCFLIAFKKRDMLPAVAITPFLWKMLIKTSIFAVIAIYLENVVTNGDDHGKDLLFFLKWFGIGKHSHSTHFPLQEPLEENKSQNHIQVKYLSKKFGNFSALSDVNVDLQAGKIHCMLGHNGAGKSTFINILIGMYKATSGRMSWMGKDLMKLHHEESDKLNIGVCPPTNILWDKMTVYQHLRMMCWIKNVSDFSGKIDTLISMFKLGIYRNYQVGQLSGGNKRKLTIAMALVGDPNIILLDEPTSALDPVARKDVWEILLELKKTSPDKIILLTTHHLEEAEKLADNIIFLAAGSVKLVGTVEELKNNFGIGYLLEIIAPVNQPREYFLGIKQNIENRVGLDFLFKDDDINVFDRKLELKIDIKDKLKMERIMEAIKLFLPEGTFVTIGTNTLEKAYIEIDKSLHKDHAFSDEKSLFKILDRLYPINHEVSYLNAVWLISKNKYHFLINHILELIKIVAQYLLTGGTIGLAIYIIKVKEIKFSAIFLNLIFSIFVLFELTFSTFSVFNLVYDNHKNIKQVMLANKIPPFVYFAGKIIVDILIQSLAFLVIFSMTFGILYDDLLKHELKSYFFKTSFAICCWKFTYFCFGFLFYRIFSTPKSVLYYYALFYILVNILNTLLVLAFGEWANYLNDFSMIFRIIRNGNYSYLEIFEIFSAFSFVYLLIAIVIDNYNMIANFINNPNTKKSKNVCVNPEDALIPIGNDDLSNIQTELKKTVAVEEEKTLNLKHKKLKITNISKKYGWKSSFAVHDVTFSVDEKVSFGLIGPNGAGKSTLFNILLSKINKTSGNVYVDGTPNYDYMSPLNTIKTPYHYNNYSICFQGDSIWDELSVEKNLSFYANLNGVNQSALNELLVYFEFEHYLTINAEDLSSGNKRKLCILISLLINPNFILYDEATCGIDINMRLRMKNIVEYYKQQNKAFAIFTTHFLKDIEIFCDKIGIIDKGEFLYVNDIDQIKQTLGGYLTILHFVDFLAKDTVLDRISNRCQVKVISERPEHAIVKAILNHVDDIFGLFSILLDLKNKDVILDFSLNQLSIEDIYLDVFNRSE